MEGMAVWNSGFLLESLSPERSKEGSFKYVIYSMILTCFMWLLVAYLKQVCYLRDAHILYKLENSTKLSDVSPSAAFQNFPSEAYWYRIAYIPSVESICLERKHDFCLEASFSPTVSVVSRSPVVQFAKLLQKQKAPKIISAIRGLLGFHIPETNSDFRVVSLPQFSHSCHRSWDWQLPLSLRTLSVQLLKLNCYKKYSCS